MAVTSSATDCVVDAVFVHASRVRSRSYRVFNAYQKAGLVSYCEGYFSLFYRFRRAIGGIVSAFSMGPIATSGRVLIYRFFRVVLADSFKYSVGDR